MSRAALAALCLLALACSGGRSPSPPVPPTEDLEPERPRPSPSESPSRPKSRKLSRAEIESRVFPEALPLPVDGVERASLTGSFHAPRSGGRRHQAIDIMAARGTPVRATTDGYVSKRAVLRLGGKTISVVGPAGYRHYYAHLDRWAGVGEGDPVVAGEIVGYVGNSGNARGGPTHLHYAIYAKDGRAIDPYPLLMRGSGSFE